MTEINKVKHYKKREFWVFIGLSVALFVSVANLLVFINSPTVFTLGIGVVLGEVIMQIKQKIEDES